MRKTITFQISSDLVQALDAKMEEMNDGHYYNRYRRSDIIRKALEEFTKEKAGALTPAHVSS